MRVSETRDLGDVNRFQFYDHMKVFTAAPPDVLRVDEKNLREYSVLNCTGVVYTTNYKDSLYLPPDDRRHYVTWSERTKEEFTEKYWKDLWQWYDAGGDKHVAAYLRRLDVTGFNPKAPPPLTDAFWQIVEINRTPQNAELADLIDAMGAPDTLTLDDIRNQTRSRLDNTFNWLFDPLKSRAVPHRMSDCGYTSVRNMGRKDGFWLISKERHVIYAKNTLSIRDRYLAAEKLVKVRNDPTAAAAEEAAAREEAVAAAEAAGREG